MSVASMVCTALHVSKRHPHNSAVISVLQQRRQKHRLVNEFGGDHAAGKCQSWDSNPGSLVPESVKLQTDGSTQHALQKTGKKIGCIPSTPSEELQDPPLRRLSLCFCACLALARVQLFTLETQNSNPKVPWIPFQPAQHHASRLARKVGRLCYRNTAWCHSNKNGQHLPCRPPHVCLRRDSKGAAHSESILFYGGLKFHVLWMMNDHNPKGPYLQRQSWETKKKTHDLLQFSPHLNRMYSVILT